MASYASRLTFMKFLTFSLYESIHKAFADACCSFFMRCSDLSMLSSSCTPLCSKICLQSTSNKNHVKSAIFRTYTKSVGVFNWKLIERFNYDMSRKLDIFTTVRLFRMPHGVFEHGYQKRDCLFYAKRTKTWACPIKISGPGETLLDLSISDTSSSFVATFAMNI